uniref:Uncharacterized protein n=1 Tax=Anopheles merus TaxID=30066 RepID=A0A182VGM8_ANOME
MPSCELSSLPSTISSSLVSLRAYPPWCWPAPSCSCILNPMSDSSLAAAAAANAAVLLIAIGGRRAARRIFDSERVARVQDRRRRRRRLTGRARSGIVRGRLLVLLVRLRRMVGAGSDGSRRSRRSRRRRRRDRRLMVTLMAVAVLMGMGRRRRGRVRKARGRLQRGHTGRHRRMVGRVRRMHRVQDGGMQRGQHGAGRYHRHARADRRMGRAGWWEVAAGRQHQLLGRRLVMVQRVMVPHRQPVPVRQVLQPLDRELDRPVRAGGRWRLCVLSVRGRAPCRGSAPGWSANVSHPPSAASCSPSSGSLSVLLLLLLWLLLARRSRKVPPPPPPPRTSSSPGSDASWELLVGVVLAVAPAPPPPFSRAIVLGEWDAGSVEAGGELGCESDGLSGCPQSDIGDCIITIVHNLAQETSKITNTAQ